MKNLFDSRRRLIRWLDRLTRLRKPVPPPVSDNDAALFFLCPSCRVESTFMEFTDHLHCCPRCGRHQPYPARQRFDLILDPGYRLLDAPAQFTDPLDFPEYKEKWLAQKRRATLDEAIAFAAGHIAGLPLILGVMDRDFMMGSMGTIVGDRVVNAFEQAAQLDCPVVIFTASGGARMQEGIVSLMQMRRTAAAIHSHQASGRLYIAVQTDPTTGGVTASFASLGDIILAEPGALIGFAGRRVIKETIKSELPPDFQTAESMYRHGFIDRIVPRIDLRAELARLLGLHAPEHLNKISHTDAQPLATLPATQSANSPETTAKPQFGASSVAQSVNSPKAAANTQRLPTAFERVRLARAPGRVSPRAILNTLCTDCVDLAGDRFAEEDSALIGGLANFEGQPITYIITEKGDTLDSQIARRFGMPNPSGYRKAQRLMRQAEKFGRPIISIIDTPGAYPGVAAEEGGQGEAIANNLHFMAGFTVPFIAIISGEAGSGGALGIACADRLYMLENAVYTLLSPEGFATILWKDASRAPEAAEKMRLTAQDMLELGVCQAIFPDNLSGLREQIRRDLHNGISSPQEQQYCDDIVE